MTGQTCQVKTRDAYGVTYANPLSPDFSVRFKTTSNAKSLNGINVDNFITEIIYNDDNEITIGDTTANDAIAVRLRASGSLNSQDRIAAILIEMSAQITAWIQENVMTGFPPVTAPIDPTVSE
jgi:hypothetical protein